MGFFRVLMLPDGQKEAKDAEGRDLGSDWLLASCGTYEDPESGKSYQVYVTTNRVHASEYGIVPDAKETAEILVKALEKYVGEPV